MKINIPFPILHQVLNHCLYLPIFMQTSEDTSCFDGATRSEHSILSPTSTSISNIAKSVTWSLCATVIVGTLKNTRSFFQMETCSISFGMPMGAWILPRAHVIVDFHSLFETSQRLCCRQLSQLYTHALVSLSWISSCSLYTVTLALSENHFISLL